MKAEVAQFIAESAIKIGIELRMTPYSGRGMFGRETTAIVYKSEGDWLRAVIQTGADIQALEIGIKDGHDAPPFDLQTLMDEVAATKRDILGYDGVVY